MKKKSYNYFIIVTINKTILSYSIICKIHANFLCVNQTFHVKISLRSLNYSFIKKKITFMMQSIDPNRPTEKFLLNIFNNYLNIFAKKAINTVNYSEL